MGHRLLWKLVEREHGQFQRVNNRWRPRHLVQFQQVRQMLKDIEERFVALLGVESEFADLPHVDLYTKLIKRMRLQGRAATYSWKSDQLVFMQAVTSFYSDYGTILYFLKMDLARDRTTDPVKHEGA